MAHLLCNDSFNCFFCDVILMKRLLLDGQPILESLSESKEDCQKLEGRQVAEYELLTVFHQLTQRLQTCVVCRVGSWTTNTVKPIGNSWLRCLFLSDFIR
jgi:hypothetical protein